MLKLYLTLQNLWADKRGVTAIEYAVLAGIVAVALSAATWGTDLTKIVDDVIIAVTPS